VVGPEVVTGPWGGSGSMEEVAIWAVGFELT